jgi:hypothetical protein
MAKGSCYLTRRAGVWLAKSGPGNRRGASEAQFAAKALRRLQSPLHLAQEVAAGLG